MRTVSCFAESALSVTSLQAVADRSAFHILVSPHHGHKGMCESRRMWYAYSYNATRLQPLNLEYTTGSSREHHELPTRRLLRRQAR
jgi:hypothetical protein